MTPILEVINCIWEVESIEIPMSKKKLKVYSENISGGFDVYRQGIISNDVAPIDSPANTGVFEVNRVSHSRGAILRLKFDAIVSDHKKSHADASSGLIQIGRYLSGGAMTHPHFLPETDTPGAITIWDVADPCAMFHKASTLDCQLIHKGALGLRETDTIRPMRLPGQSLAARVLHNEWDNLTGVIEREGGRIYQDDYERFVDCVRMAVFPDGQNEGVRKHARLAQFDLVCKYIDARVNDPMFGPAEVLETFAIPRATLYRMFQSGGGIKAYIMRKRLYGAVLELAETPLRRGQISATAERWGFRSRVSFNRLVRNTFGASPGSLYLAPMTKKPHVDYLSELRAQLEREPPG